MAHKLAGPHCRAHAHHRRRRHLLDCASLLHHHFQPAAGDDAGRADVALGQVAVARMLDSCWRLWSPRSCLSNWSTPKSTPVGWRALGQEHQWGRVLFSNVIGIPLDRILFLLVLAFAGALMSHRGNSMDRLRRNDYRAAGLRHHIDTGHLPGRRTFRRLGQDVGDYGQNRPAVVYALRRASELRRMAAVARASAPAVCRRIMPQFAVWSRL